MTMKTRRRGRPEGRPNSPHLVVDLVPAHCPHCQSTDRKTIRIIREQEAVGTSPAGSPRTHIVWRRVRCDHCRAYFTEMVHENRVG